MTCKNVIEDWRLVIGIKTYDHSYDHNNNCSNNYECDNNHDTDHYYNDFHSENTDSIDINQNNEQMERHFWLSWEWKWK